MKRIELDSDSKQWIEQTIRNYTSESSPEPPYLKALAANHAVLPLFIGWTGFFGIRADRTIIIVHTEEPGEPSMVEHEERVVNLVLYQGSLKYPYLTQLIPTRAPTARDCPHCDGRGEIELSGAEPSRLVCYCGGLGWLPESCEDGMSHPPLIGDASKARIFSFVIDNFFACALSLLVVAAISSAYALVSSIALCLTYLLYFFVLELFWGRTLGKFFQGLVIRDVSGCRCNVTQVLLRTLARILEANPVLLGGVPAGIAIMASRQRQRIGDALAHTVVVSRQVLRTHRFDAAKG